MGIGRQTVLGLLWTGSANYLGFAMSFAGQLVLVRILVPEDFGIVAFAGSLFEVLSVFTAWSLSIGIVQTSKADGLIDTALWLSFGQSLLLAFIVVCMALILSLYVESPILPLVFASLGIGRAVGPVSSIYAALLEKELKYGALSIMKASTTVVSTLMAILCALGGSGVWSLVVKEVVGSLLSLGWSRYISGWRFSGEYNSELAKRLFGMGNQTFLSRGLEAAYSKIDSLLIGILAGTTSLGYYSQARYVVDLANAGVAPATGTVIFPIYARLQNDHDRLERTYRTGIFFLVRLMLPACLIFFLFPHELMVLVFGKQWRPAGDVLRWLAFLPFIVPLFENCKALLYGVGRFGTTARVRAIQIAVGVPLIAGGYIFWNLPGAALGLTVAACVGLLAILFSTRTFASATVSGTMIRPMAVALVTIMAVSWLQAIGILAIEGPGVVGSLLGTVFVYVLLLVAIEFNDLCKYASVVLGAFRAGSTSGGTASENKL